jgi:hypothetical protein
MWTTVARSGQRRAVLAGQHLLGQEGHHVRVQGQSNQYEPVAENQLGDEAFANPPSAAARSS